MVKQTMDEKVVELLQTEKRSKLFRPEYPVSEELLQVMVNEVFQDFVEFALKQYYYPENLTLLSEFIEEHGPAIEKRQGLLGNLFWWHLFYESNLRSEWSCFEDYITQKKHLFKNRSFITSWLRECNRAVPKFYYVGTKHSDTRFVLIDILAEETLDIILCNKFPIAPKKGEIVMGILLPLGGGLFFPIVDFYRFDYEAREAIVSCIHHYYDTHLKTSSLHEAFIHVLSAMLQIERIIYMEKQENYSSETSNSQK